MEIANAISKPQARTRADRGPIPYRLTVDQFVKMIDLGFFPDRGSRVELLDERLFRKVTKKPPHDFAVSVLAELLRVSLPVAWCIREEKAILLGPTSLPKPDIAVVRGRLRDFAYRSQEPSETSIVIEVADWSYAKDRGLKGRMYAAARIPQYGILNIRVRRFELYSNPAGAGKSAAYQESQIFEETDLFSLRLHDEELGPFKVEDLLPRVLTVEPADPVIVPPEPSETVE